MVEEVLKNGEKVVRIAENVQYSGTITTIISLLFLFLVSFGSLAFYKRDKEKRKEEKEDNKTLMEEMKRNNKTSMSTMQKIADAVKEFAESNRTLADIIEKNEFNHQNFVSESQQIRRDYLNAIERVNDSSCNVEKKMEKLENKHEGVAADVKEILAIVKVGGK